MVSAGLKESSYKRAPLARSAAMLLLSATISACGGHSGNGDESRQRVAGAAVKGPFQASTVRVYEHDTAGEVTASPPLAQTTTDAKGNFSIPGPETQTALIGVSGGGFYDESDPDGMRFIVWPTTAELLGFLPEGETSAAITPLSDHLVRKSRRDAANNGLDFVHAMNENRRQAIRAFDFDPISVIPPNPTDPPPGASMAQLHYATYLGGIAMAVNTAALQLGQPAPDFDLLEAVLEDLEDCELDGRYFGDTIFVNDEPLPDNIDLDNEIARFRNNNFDKLGGVPLLVIDRQVCANNLPRAADDSATTAQDTPITLNVLANDNDPDGSLDFSTLEIVAPPSAGQAIINTVTGEINYSPNAGYSGGDSFSYRIQDDLGTYTNTATVSISVTLAAACVPPRPGMVAWFTGDLAHTQGQSTYDIQGGLAGELRHGASSGQTGGQVDQALDFDGDDDVVQVDALATFAAPQLTIEAWVNLSSIPSGGGAIFTKRRNNSPGQFESIHLSVNNVGKFSAVAFTDNGLNQVRGARVIQPGNWYHVALTFDGARMHLYVDGTVDEELLVATAPAIDYNPAHPVFIGNNHTTGIDPNVPRRFPGLIDELALYERTLSNDEITAIYNAGPLGKCKPANTSDADGDGLDLSQELTLGTNPNNADTDGDGLTDGEEVHQTNTDPTHADPDGDGVGDAIEVFYGTDPDLANPTVYASAARPNNNGNGSSWATAKRDNSAIDGVPAAVNALSGAANKPVYVLYNAGTYDPLVVPQNFDVIFVGSVGPGLYTPLWPPTTVFDAAFSTRPLEVIGNDSGTASLRLRFRNIELRHGTVFEDSGGGALLREGAVGSFTRVFFDQMLIRHNRAFGEEFAEGGGIHASVFAFTLRDSLVQENFATYDGGGIAVAGKDNNALLQRNIIAANEARGSGGGIYAPTDVPTILTLEDNLILSNHASGTTSSGGGLYYQSSDPANTSLLLSNNLIVGNAANLNEAGGVVINGRTGAGTGRTLTTLQFNTIAYNQLRQADDLPGGLYVDNANRVSLLLTNNIVWYNDDTNVNAAPDSQAGGGPGSPRHTDNAGFTDADTASGQDNNINATNAAGSENFGDSGDSGVRAPPNNSTLYNPLFANGFYLDPTSKMLDLSSLMATDVSLFDGPYTTQANGVADTGNLDLGFHHRQPAIGPADAIALETQPYVGDYDVATVIFTPTAGGQPIGPGHLVGACLNTDLSVYEVMFDSLTTLAPFSACTGEQVLAIDLGDGRYAFKLQSNTSQTINDIDFTIYIDQIPTALPISVDVEFPPVT